MPWSSKPKDIGVTDVVPRRNLGANLIGRAPGIAAINFTPLELYGAMARSHYTHLVNPHVVTWEVSHMMYLLEQHVDDLSHDFALLASADTMKDYVKAYFAGTVATGIAYLAMINDGYVWADHWENVIGGAPGVRKTPDFVFAGPGTGVALMESKGTRSATLGAFDQTVADGYTDQVEPHLGFIVGSAAASHGYCIGSHLSALTHAELRIHHTEVPAPAQPGGGSAPAVPQVVQRHSYATAFTLAHGPGLGLQLRNGRRRAPIVFFEFDWAGRSWVSSHPPGGDDASQIPSAQWGALPYIQRPDIPGIGRSGTVFAIEKTVATVALEGFLAPGGRDRAEIVEVDSGLPFEPGTGIERAEGGGAFGAVFPDGFAAIRDLQPERLRVVFWDDLERRFSDAEGDAWQRSARAAVALDFRLVARPVLGRTFVDPSKPTA